MSKTHSHVKDNIFITDVDFESMTDDELDALFDGNKTVRRAKSRNKPDDDTTNYKRFTLSDISRLPEPSASDLREENENDLVLH